MLIGFILEMMGNLLSIIILISGLIIPDKNDKNRSTIIPRAVFVLGFNLLDTPINTPSSTPNRFPKSINMVLYFISWNK